MAGTPSCECQGDLPPAFTKWRRRYLPTVAGRGLQTTIFVTCWLNRSYNQEAAEKLFEPRSPTRMISSNRPRCRRPLPSGTRVAAQQREDSERITAPRWQQRGEPELAAGRRKKNRKSAGRQMVANSARLSVGAPKCCQPRRSIN